MKQQDLSKLAKLLSNQCQFEPPIDQNAKGEVLKNEILDVTKIIDAQDEFDEELMELLREFVKENLDEYKQTVIDLFISIGIIVNDTITVDEEEEEEIDDENKNDDVFEDLSLEDQIEEADTRKNLIDIAKANDEFKQLRGMISKYKDMESLRAAMLDYLVKKKEEEKDSPKKEIPTKSEEEEEKDSPKKEIPTKPKHDEKGQVFKKVPVKERVAFYTDLIKQGKYTKNELIEMADKNFAGANPTTNRIIMSRGFSENHNQFHALLKKDEKTNVITFSNL